MDSKCRKQIQIHKYAKNNEADEGRIKANLDICEITFVFVTYRADPVGANQNASKIAFKANMSMNQMKTKNINKTKTKDSF